MSTALAQGPAAIARGGGGGGGGGGVAVGIQAIDLATRETLWTERQRAPQTTGVLATAGGLVFAGSLDRVLTAYDDATGSALFAMPR